MGRGWEWNGSLSESKRVKKNVLVSKHDDERESGAMEMVEGRRRDNAGRKKKRSSGCEISGRMEDKRGEVI